MEKIRLFGILHIIGNIIRKEIKMDVINEYEQVLIGNLQRYRRACSRMNRQPTNIWLCPYSGMRLKNFSDGRPWKLTGFFPRLS